MIYFDENAFLVDFDCLVCLCCDETAVALIKGHAKDTALAVQGAGLRDALNVLEAVPRAVVPERQGAIVCTRGEHAIGVDAQAVDNGCVAAEVLDKLAPWKVPLLDVVWCTRHKGKPGTRSMF